MTKRIVAIIFIFFITSIAWAILGGTILTRTYDSGALSGQRVESTWGTEHNQAPPTAAFSVFTQTPTDVIENGAWVKDNIWGGSSSYAPVHLPRETWMKYQRD